jgi:transcriptional regulator with GAF, ATPase, and Fis domain
MQIKQGMNHRTKLSSYELLLECRDQAMKKVTHLVSKCANGRSVLLLGENGVGKEVVAQALRERSDRSIGPMAVLDCANLTGDLLKSELFGHEKGSFTGAAGQHIGLFERANGGTAFLDEIGEVPLEEQAKLLRVVQERSFTRLGGGKQITSDFRLVVATNKDLPRMVTEKKFRQDLYFRLQTFTIQIPPLRERMEDVIRLANLFVDQFSSETKMLSTEAEKLVMSHSWPGNVRELKNAIERGVLFSHNCESISEEDLGVSIVPNSSIHAAIAGDQELQLTDAEAQLIKAIRNVAEEIRHGGVSSSITKKFHKYLLQLSRRYFYINFYLLDLYAEHRVLKDHILRLLTISIPPLSSTTPLSSSSDKAALTRDIFVARRRISSSRESGFVRISTTFICSGDISTSVNSDSWTLD